ncbi:MAG TPA: Crp/Fnr family transcriptional regulator [Mycobacteriales bacterium]|nr:Crp/Fnr family transcriptional regulator [Mycobacteriales bacterium]
MSGITRWALEQTMLLGGLDETTLDRLAQASSTRRYGRGQRVVRDGDPGGDLLVVAEGRIKVVTRSADGGNLLLTVAVPGDSLGEISLLDLEARSATLEAAEPSVVITVPGPVIREAIRSAPDLAEDLLRQQAALIRRLAGPSADLVFLDLPHRVAAYVVDRANRDGRVDLGLSNAELVAAVGEARQSMDAALRGFQRRGWIHVEDRVVTVRDRAALAGYAAAEATP